MTTPRERDQAPALIVAQNELAHAEAEVAAAQALLDTTPLADVNARRIALAQRSYYGQQATRYRSELARLRRESGELKAEMERGRARHERRPATRTTSPDQRS